MLEKDKGDNSIVPFEWAVKALTKPVLKEVGLDIREGYKVLKKIAVNAIKKNPDSGIANKRVAIEVLRSGGFSESEISVEYFGGVLASSKTKTGKDDGGIYYANIIKSLSSKQLHLHYIIYNSIQKMFFNDPEKYGKLEMGKESEVVKGEIFFSSIELDLKMKLELDVNIFALIQAGLLHTDFEVLEKEIEGKMVRYMKVSPRILGIQLYAISHNKLKEWRKYNREDYGNFENIELPIVFESSLERFSKL